MIRIGEIKKFREENLELTLFMNDEEVLKEMEKFKPGDILEYIGGAIISALPGAKIKVINCNVPCEYLQTICNNNRFINVEWVDDKSNYQNNGCYNIFHFKRI